MLLSVFAAQNGQTFADGGSHHERVGGAQAVFVRLSQCEFFKVKPQLTHVGLLFDGHLTSVGSVFPAWIARVHEDSLILIGRAATGELERTASAVRVGTFADRLTGTTQTVRLGQAGAGLTILHGAGSVLESNDGQKTCALGLADRGRIRRHEMKENNENKRTWQGKRPVDLSVRDTSQSEHE